MLAGEQTALSGLALGLCQDSSPAPSGHLLSVPASRPLPAHPAGASWAGPSPGSTVRAVCPRAALGSPQVSPAAASPPRARAGRAGPPAQGHSPEMAGLARRKVWALTQRSCSPSLKALYAGMNSFSQGDLKALLTKWVTFLGIFIRLVRFCRARQLFWNFRSDIKATKEVGMIWNTVEFGLWGYREMGGDVWQGLCTFAAAHKVQIYRLKKAAAVRFPSDRQDRCHFRPHAACDLGRDRPPPWRRRNERLLHG